MLGGLGVEVMNVSCNISCLRLVGDVCCVSFSIMSPL